MLWVFYGGIELNQLLRKLIQSFFLNQKELIKFELKTNFKFLKFYEGENLVSNQI